ncbi:MAG: hypothetical protein II307_01530, partial [Alistipes sp.]|nr:hypothetical protein [Alistipes sp.]
YGADLEKSALFLLSPHPPQKKRFAPKKLPPSPSHAGRDYTALAPTPPSRTKISQTNAQNKELSNRKFHIVDFLLFL